MTDDHEEQSSEARVGRKGISKCVRTERAHKTGWHVQCEGKDVDQQKKKQEAIKNK